MCITITLPSTWESVVRARMNGAVWGVCVNKAQLGDVSLSDLCWLSCSWSTMKNLTEASWQTTGHLIFKCEQICKKAIENDEDEATEQGWPSMKFARVLDNLKEKHKNGMMIKLFSLASWETNGCCWKHEGHTKQLLNWYVSWCADWVHYL